MVNSARRRGGSVAAAAAALLIAVTSPGVTSFQLQPQPHRRVSMPAAGRLSRSNALRTVTTSLHSENPNKESEIPKEEEVVGESYEGSVDWDAEWKKVVEDRDQPAERPGKYKSQAEIAAIKTTNKVAKNVFDASQDMKSKVRVQHVCILTHITTFLTNNCNWKLPGPPDIRSLQGDWRFWIGMIVIVSFGLSILSATSAPVNESFYI